MKKIHNNVTATPLNIKAIVINICLILLLLFSATRVPYTGAYIDDFLFDFLFGTFKYVVYLYLITILVIKCISNNLFKKIFFSVKFHAYIWTFAIGAMIAITGVYQIIHSLGDKSEFVPLLSQYAEKFMDYVKHGNTYDNFFNQNWNGGIGTIVLFGVVIFFAPIAYCAFGVLIIVIAALILFKKNPKNLFSKKTEEPILLEEKDLVTNLEQIKEEISHDKAELPNANYLIDTSVNNDVKNMSTVEKHLEIIKNVLNDYKIGISKIETNIMPIFSQIIFNVQKNEFIDDVLKLQNVFSEKLKNTQFIIVNKEKTFTFEFINEHASKICLKNLLRKVKNKDVLPVGIDLEKNVVTFDLEDSHTTFIAGKPGSGGNMITNSLIAGFAYLNEPTKSDIILMDVDSENKKFLNNFNSLIHVHTGATYGIKKCEEMIKKILVTGINKKTLVVFNDFEKFVKYSYENRKLLIDLLKYAKSIKRLFIVLTTNVIDNDSAGTDIYSLFENKFILKTNSANESYSLLNSNRAFELYGYGDAYFIYKDELKKRMQSIYIGKDELDEIVNIINLFYTVKKQD
jgi:hypothetical protein